MRALTKKLLCPIVLSFLCLFGVATAALGQRVAAYDNFTLVVTPDGKAWSFGSDEYGQLGHDATPATVPNQAPGLNDIQAVAAGYAHALALTSTGAVYGWGGNFHGQVGDGTNADRSSPVLLSLSNIVAIAAGRWHSLALASNGDLYAWGENSDGRVRRTRGERI